MDCAPSADDQPKSTLHHHDEMTTAGTLCGHSISVDSSEGHPPGTDNAQQVTLWNDTVKEQAAVSDDTVAASLAITWSCEDEQAKSRARPINDAKEPGAVSVLGGAAAPHGKNESCGGLHSDKCSADQSLENDCADFGYHSDTISDAVVLSGGLDDPDLEYGEYGGLSDPSNMAVAMTVIDDADCFLPSALEFDPDAKPLSSRSSHCAQNTYRWVYVCLALSMLLAVAVGVGLVVSRSLSNSSSSSLPAALDERETVGIRESIVRFLGHSSAHFLDDPSHAYNKALKWIQNNDPLALTPASPHFVQRYLMAYLYYTTSVLGPWHTGCDPAALLPPTSTIESNDCMHVYTDTEDADIVNRVGGKRWLSGEHECLWGGVFCDAIDQVEELKFSTLIRKVKLEV
jgi:hypothetical protein